MPVTSRAADLRVLPAVDGIMAAFDNYPLVGLGERHGLAEMGDLYIDIISDPRFAERVGNVIVEFGGSADQKAIDAYLDGRDVPYADLRRAFTDNVTWFPAVINTMYLEFFAQVRRVNLGLPPDKRIKVWLGQPPIDWTKINSRGDLQPYTSVQNTFPADLIDREILAKGKRALVIYGDGHFDDFVFGPWGVKPARELGTLVRERHPGALFVVRTYVGLQTKACSAQFEAEVKDWSKATFAMPVRGTWLDQALHRPGCPFLPTIMQRPGSPPPTFSPEMSKQMETAARGQPEDGFLFLGPSASLRRSASDPTFILDQAYFSEMSRRWKIVTGTPIDWGEWVKGEARSPGRYVNQ